MRTKEKKVNNNFIAILIIAILLLFSAHLFINNYSKTTYGESDCPILVVDSKTMHVGQTFEIAVELTENTGLEAVVLQLDYDQSVFTLMKVERGNAISSLTFTTTNVNTNLGYNIRPFKMLWDGRAPDNSTGTMVVFTFQASRNAAKRDYDISITYEEKNTKSSYGVKVPLDISGGIVTLIGGIYSVNYVDHDGSILQTTEYNEEATPEFYGPEPERPETDAYTYIFNGWVPVANENPKLLIYEADYIEIPKIYTVNYYLEGDLFLTKDYPYGEDITKVEVEDREYYEFSGWCTDYLCKNKLKKGSTMPSHDINLYGRYLFNQRTDEIDIPVIELIASDAGDGLIRVNVELISNTGLSGMILTLDYDIAEMSLINVERGNALPLLQFETTNTDNGYDEIPFRLYWEGVQNDYSEGTIAVLYFRMEEDLLDGQYFINMTYNSGQDVSYIEDGNIIYSDVVIQAAMLVVSGGEFQWNTEEPDSSEYTKLWLIIIIVLSIMLFIAIVICIYLLIRYVKLKYRFQVLDSCNNNKCDYYFDILKKESMFYFIITKDGVIIGKSKEYSSKNSCISAIFNLRKYLNKELIINDGKGYKYEFGEVLLEAKEMSDKKYFFRVCQANNILFESKVFKNLSECNSIIKSLKNAELYHYIGENIDDKEYVNDCDYRFNIFFDNKQYYFKVKRKGVLIGISKKYEHINSCINAVFNLRKNLSRKALIYIDNISHNFGFGEVILLIDQSSEGKCKFSIYQENNIMFISEEFNDILECKSIIESLRDAKVFRLIRGLDA